jgi:excisionase family DNA binding protein
MPANEPASPRGGVNSNSETNSPSDSSPELVPATGNGNQSERRTARGQPASYEFIDCGELARRWEVPVTYAQHNESIFEQLLDSDEAAALLKIHPKTLQKMARTGEITGVQIGKLWRFRASVLNDWLEHKMAS